MPYYKNSDLPASVADVLPKHAKEIYRAAFNNAWEQYQDQGDEQREETAHKVAWSAVKKEYEKDEASGKWVKKKETQAERSEAH